MEEIWNGGGQDMQAHEEARNQKRQNQQNNSGSRGGGDSSRNQRQSQGGEGRRDERSGGGGASTDRDPGSSEILDVEDDIGELDTFIEYVQQVETYVIALKYRRDEMRARVDKTAAMVTDYWELKQRMQSYGKSYSSSAEHNNRLRSQIASLKRDIQVSEAQASRHERNRAQMVPTLQLQLAALKRCEKEVEEEKKKLEQTKQAKNEFTDKLKAVRDRHVELCESNLSAQQVIAEIEAQCGELEASRVQSLQVLEDMKLKARKDAEAKYEMTRQWCLQVLGGMGPLVMALVPALVSCIARRRAWLNKLESHVENLLEELADQQRSLRRQQVADTLQLDKRKPDWTDWNSETWPHEAITVDLVTLKVVAVDEGGRVLDSPMGDCDVFECVSGKREVRVVEEKRREVFKMLPLPFDKGAFRAAHYAMAGSDGADTVIKLYHDRDWHVNSRSAWNTCILYHFCNQVALAFQETLRSLFAPHHHPSSPHTPRDPSATVSSITSTTSHSSSSSSSSTSSNRTTIASPSSATKPPSSASSSSSHSGSAPVTLSFIPAHYATTPAAPHWGAFNIEPRLSSSKWRK
ncbi:hypothetical protein HK102_013200, partial [Quaeritorhiza haematococci]